MKKEKEGFSRVPVKAMRERGVCAVSHDPLTLPIVTVLSFF